MTSIDTHHAEWLSLIEVSGPFLSLPVLSRAFPQGLDAHDPDHARSLRLAYEEWRDNIGGLRPDPAIHTAWLHYVLRFTLEYSDDVLRDGQAIPDTLKVTIPEHGETIRPDLLLADPHTQRPALLIYLYPESQGLERSLPDRRWAASPAARMLELLHATGTRLGLITNGAQWMLIDAPRGETTGYTSWFAELWSEEALTLRAFRSLLGLRRFFGVAENQTLEALLAESSRDQQEVTEQLGYQVRQAVEILIQALDRADQDRGRALLAEIGVGILYESALTVMMRLVFLFTAEERGLLLLGDPLYDQSYAVSTLGGQLREQADQFGEEVLERSYDAWCRLLATFHAVYGGLYHDRLTLPAYGSSLFDPDRFTFLEGRPLGSQWRNTLADPLPINNRTTLHLLEAIGRLRVRVPGGGYESRKLSFRALDIEQIGHVYEGLLDHQAVRADAIMIGLTGKTFNEKEVPLATLEEYAAQGEDALIELLKTLTRRTGAALRKALSTPPVDKQRLDRLRTVCSDAELFARVLPFFGLIRNDDLDYPVVIAPGSVYVTEGATRRESGTHYTPRSLTEPIVQRTLEPLVYIGPADGLPRDAWVLHRASELLRLKICDMAMGSGAFLVQVCRYLSERLVEAWEREALTAVEPMPGLYPGELLHTQPLPTDREERLTLARRLIADRCLYGVDKNPLAVEMAKLSLWLITLDKGRPFNFLDHALKAGDSIIGVDLDQLRYWDLNPQSGQEMMIGWGLRDQIDQAVETRRALESFGVNTIADQERKAYLMNKADEQTAYLKRAADHLISRIYNGTDETDILQRVITQAELPPAVELGDLRPFHWQLEFPEVFFREDAPGFDAFVGNPPFVGGQRISGQFGKGYLSFLKARWFHAPGSADFCTYFFLKAYENLHPGGVFGLIATNTIAQGDTRALGLDHLVQMGGTIYNAINNQAWPGTAAVVVDVVTLYKGHYGGENMLDGHTVSHITSLLDEGETLKPYVLAANANKSFIGSYVLGMGFVLEPEEAQALIDKDPRNADVLFPYLNGEDLNQRPDQSPSRWVINFFDWDLEQAEQYPDCMAIVRERVKPERLINNDKGGRDFWWRYLRPRPELYRTIARLERVLVLARVSKSVAFALVPNGIIFNEKVVVFPFETHFGVLQSTLHNIFAWKYSSTLKSDLNYSPSDVLDTFPFSADLSGLESISETYHDARQTIMLTRQEGLTTTYNRFHNPDERADDIAYLRDLHIEMDHAVAAAYGWDDLALDHGFHTTAQGVRFTVSASARRELLSRLLRLNHARYAEEVVAGLHVKGGKGKKKSAVQTPRPQSDEFPDQVDQVDMFEDNLPHQKRML